ncbi:hypothetical protein Tco_0618584 [Tanacetum coccineum]
MGDFHLFADVAKYGRTYNRPVERSGDGKPSVGSNSQSVSINENVFQSFNSYAKAVLGNKSVDMLGKYGTSNVGAESVGGGRILQGRYGSCVHGAIQSYDLSQHTLHVSQHLDHICHGELEKLQGSILAYETVKLLRDVNDADLSKARAFMTAISLIQIKDYEAKVIITSKLKYFMFIKDKLSHKRRKLFRTSCFGKWLNLAYCDHEPHMIDYMLQRLCYVNDAHYDMPLIFSVHGRGLHFGRCEFSLITGLKIASLDLIGVIEDEEFFSKLCDEDFVRVCLLLSLEVIFMGRKLVHEFDDTLMRLVENLEA